jgi:hypothetical protein
VSKPSPITKQELAKIEAYLKRTFGTRNLTVRPRPKLTDSAEVYIGDEFIATVSLDAEEGARDFTLQMSILEIDLDEG